MTSYFKRKGGAALIQLVNPPVNGLSHKVRSALMQDLDRAVQDKAPAVVLMGAGNHFSAGADIAEFARGGHRTSPALTEVVERLDAYGTPLVAAIHGTALGGGLETALACHWRMASSNATLGLPEVKLGLLPGAGGTQRLPRLTGVAAAVELMSTGRTLTAQDALKLGIVDRVVSGGGGGGGGGGLSEALADAAVAFALSEEVQGTPLAQRRVSQRPVQGDTSEELFRTLLDGLKKSAKGAAAPLAIFKAVQAAAVFRSFPDGMKKEKELFEELAKGPQAKALQYFFFSERRVAAVPEDVLQRQPRAATPVAPTKSAAVVGGGAFITRCFLRFVSPALDVSSMPPPL